MGHRLAARSLRTQDNIRKKSGEHASRDTLQNSVDSYLNENKFWL